MDCILERTESFMRPPTATDRLAVANTVLQSFAPRASLRRSAETGHIIVCWTEYNGKKHERRWMTRRQDFYPTWGGIWPGGGTSMVALSQLVRWCNRKPVLPLSTWEWWAGDKCKLLRQQGDNGAAALAALRSAGYPEKVDCVLCDHPIKGGLDWWRVGKVSGPCCGMSDGCRQTGKWHDPMGFVGEGI